MSSAGALPNGLRYEAQVRVLGEGGAVTAADGKIAFQSCDSLTLLLACGTDYVMDAAKHWRGADPHARVIGQLRRGGGQAVRGPESRPREGLSGRSSAASRWTWARRPPSRRALPTDRRKGLDSEATTRNWRRCCSSTAAIC